MATVTQVQVRPGKLFIGGKWVDAASGRTFPTTNPATGATLAQLAGAGAADVGAAVAAARNAFEEGPWPAMAAADRQRLLLRIADAVEAKVEELAALETL